MTGIITNKLNKTKKIKKLISEYSNKDVYSICIII